MQREKASPQGSLKKKKSFKKSESFLKDEVEIRHNGFVYLPCFWDKEKGKVFGVSVSIILHENLSDAKLHYLPLREMEVLVRSSACYLQAANGFTFLNDWTKSKED